MKNLFVPSSNTQMKLEYYHYGDVRFHTVARMYLMIMILKSRIENQTIDFVTNTEYI